MTILFGSMIALVSTLCALLLVPLDRSRAHALAAADSAADTSATPQNDEESSPAKPNRVSLGAMASFPAQLWLMVAIAFIFYSVTFPFISLSKLFFVKKYAASTTLASLQQSLFFLCTVLTSPLFGKLVDLIGHNLHCVIVSFLLVIAAHLLFMFTYVNSFVAVVLVGTSLSLIYASLWPMVSMIVPSEKLATAYGLMQSFQNLGLAITNIVVGLILENFGYFVLELFFLIFSVGKSQTSQL